MSTDSMTLIRHGGKPGRNDFLLLEHTQSMPMKLQIHEFGTQANF